MTKFSSSDREIIRFIFSKRDWVDLYALHVEFRLTPAQMLDILERLSAVGLAERQGTEARLTPQGREWVLAARDDIFFNTNVESWRPSSEQLLSDTMDPGAPYLPDLKLLDRKFFLNLALYKKIDDDMD